MPRSNKPPKDPNAPKRYQSGYFIFTSDRRSTLQQQHPEKKITEIAKLLGEEWKVLDPERKKAYNDKAAVQKEEYKIALEKYQQTDSYKNHLRKLEEWKAQQKVTPSKNVKLPSKPRKPKKPESYPKGFYTGFLLFSNERRPILQNENSTKKITEISKLIGAEWKILSNEKKQKYQDISNEQKAKNKLEMDKYKLTEDYKKYKEELTLYNKKLNQWKKKCKELVENANENGNKKNKRKRKNESSSDESSSDSDSSSSDDSSDSSSDDSSSDSD